jgi:hypothetical protein
LRSRTAGWIMRLMRIFMFAYPLGMSDDNCSMSPIKVRGAGGSLLLAIHGGTL